MIEIVLGVLGVLVPIGIALQGFTVRTLLSIERRLTRLETLQGLPPGGGPGAPRARARALAASERT